MEVFLIVYFVGVVVAAVCALIEQAEITGQIMLSDLVVLAVTTPASWIFVLVYLLGKFKVFRFEDKVIWKGNSL